MYFREVVFGQEPYLSPRGSKKNWVVLASTILVFAIAWHYGIIASSYHLTKDLAEAAWNMLMDVYSSIRDLLQYIVAHRQ